MLIDVIAVHIHPEFQLDLEFENGERRRFDMRPLLAMKPWNRIAVPAVFERARVVRVNYLGRSASIILAGEARGFLTLFVTRLLLRRSAPGYGGTASIAPFVAARDRALTD